MRWHLKHKSYGDVPWAVQTAYLDAAGGRRKFGSFLEQGLGKTSANLNEFVDAGDVDLNVVLAPSSFIGDWPLAPTEWGIGFMKTGQYPRDPLPFDWDCGLYAFAHETLRGSANARRALMELLKKRRCLLTFDEATGIKNPSSLLARFMVTEASREATMVRLLDGTPMVQNVMDYYPKLRCLGELNGVNPLAFRNRYANTGGFMGKQIVGINSHREQELVEILNKCSFRALKKDWRKDMPDQVQHPIHLEMTNNQRKHYQTMMEDFCAILDSGEEIDAELVLTQRMKFQQISSCMLMRDGAAFWIEKPENNPKLKAIFDFIEIGRGKSIIVYTFGPSGHMLIDEMSKKGLNPAWITGGMDSTDLLRQKERFNNDSSCRVIVAQQDQGSRGHTLLGQPGNDRCNKTFYYENSLSLMHRLQMNDRNHRGAQDETCYLIDFICCPIDQINTDILTRKKSYADGMDALIKLVKSKQAT